jgi:hypothetical protein
MGAETWSCFTPYRENVAEALEACQQVEFAAGRYRKPWGFEGTHASIDEAFLACDTDGTCSVLDMIGVADSPRPSDFSLEDAFEGDFDFGFMQVAPLSTEQLLGLFGTEQPTRSMLEQATGFYEWLDRGLGIYIVAYDDGKPSDIFFAGYSLD